MQAHEWISSKDGRVLKTDACAHGNDHFFPGPCDIAWDLAGAAVEWGFDSDATEHMLSRFQRLTGDDARSRFDGYALAYSVFRLAWCKMAISTMQDEAEELRLRHEYWRYRARAQRELIKRMQGEQTELLVRLSDSNALRLAS
jgi:thiamine kinase-like enzyme